MNDFEQALGEVSLSTVADARGSSKIATTPAAASTSLYDLKALSRWIHADPSSLTAVSAPPSAQPILPSTDASASTTTPPQKWPFCGKYLNNGRDSRAHPGAECPFKTDKQRARAQAKARAKALPKARNDGRVKKPLTKEKIDMIQQRTREKKLLKQLERMGLRESDARTGKSGCVGQLKNDMEMAANVGERWDDLKMAGN
jgi:hypothetical protein